MQESQSFSIPLLGLAAVVGMAIVLLIGCTGDDDLKTEPAASHPHAAGGRFLALGDSYTIGESVAESDRWPLQLAELLSEEGIEVGTPTIVARTGWTSGELLDRINTARPTGVFEVVTLQIGVNDQFRGLDESQFARDLDALLDLAIEFSGDDPSRVVVLSIPDWGVTPFAAGHNRDVIASEIDRFNQLKRERVVVRGCQFIDVTSISRQAAADRTLLADDGLHPSAKMYSRWCQLALPAVRKALSAGPSSPSPKATRTAK
ncbi:MAG: SGNH/GDSL hydrolase family protein [Pirellulaceae bacterium]